MSRYVGPSCRLCRREATKLFLKGTKCLTEKCPVERRAYPPGQHGQTGGRQRKASEYAKQMREKQKVKRMYGLSEQQFRNTFDDVTREPGRQGHQPAGGAREPAGQHRLPDGLRVEPQGGAPAHRPRAHPGERTPGGHPAYRVAPGEEVRVAPSSRENVSVKLAQETASRGQPVSWISVDTDKAAGRVTERPTRDAIPINAQEQLIVELYSK